MSREWGVKPFVSRAFGLLAVVGLVSGVWACSGAAQTTSSTARAELVDVFNAARIARAEGRYRDAIPVLRDLVRRLPDDVGVREELGYALLLDKQYAAAQFHFQILAERSTNPRSRQLYDAVLRRIVSERPAGLRLIFALVPSSNVNGGSDSASFNSTGGVVTIDDESRAKEGWRWSLGVAGYFRHALSERDVVRLDWSALETASDLSEIEPTRELSAQITWQRSFARASAYVTLGASEQRARSEIRSRTNYGFGSTHRVGKRGQIGWTYSYSDTDFDTRIAMGDFRSNPRRSGPLRVGRLRYTWLLPSTQSVWLGVQFEDSDPGATSQRYDGRILQMGGVKRFRSGLSIDGVMSFGARDFTGDFGLQNFARRDDFTELSLSAQHSKVNWKGFSPRVTCIARMNRSNIGLFDATTHECGFRLTRGF
ncbi:MAG: porin family protein [Aliishimia sp.]